MIGHLIENFINGWNLTKDMLTKNIPLFSDTQGRNE